MASNLSENGLKWKYLQPFNIQRKFWFLSNGPTFSQSVILKLSALTLVGLVSQIKLSVSVCLFVYLSLHIFHHFSRMTEYFFWNLAYGPLRHCGGGHKHTKNSHVPATLGLFLPIFVGFFTFLFFLRRVWHFFMKCCRNVLVVTLMVTTHKKITAWHSLLRVILGYFWLILMYFPLFF